MEDYQYSSNSDEDSALMSREQARIMSALVKGEYPQSHCYYAFYAKDKPKGYWGVERLPELLALYREGVTSDRNTLYVATLWSDQPGLIPETGDFNLDNRDELPEGTLEVITQGTLMNMSDFIYGCCVSQEIVYEYIVEIATLLVTPIAAPTEDDYFQTLSSLYAVGSKLADSKQTPFH